MKIRFWATALLLASVLYLKFFTDWQKLFSPLTEALSQSTQAGP